MVSGTGTCVVQFDQPGDANYTAAPQVTNLTAATPSPIADLVVTSVSNPPALAAPGSSFSVTDSVKNQGTLGAGVSTTRYYLSLDTTIGIGDILLTGTRAAGKIGTGATSTGTVNVTIPTSTALVTYYLLACADDTTKVSEGDETNNCRASAGTVQIERPDLRATAVTNPPATAKRNTSFAVTDTVTNQGLVSPPRPRQDSICRAIKRREAAISS